MKVRPANPSDVASWLEIVREVEPLFGPMPDFEPTLARKMDQRAALCIGSDGPDPRVLGGVLLGGVREHGWIRWLAVRATARRTGAGRSLVEAALGRMAGAKAISLDTFREENVAGWPARRLYARMGFVAGPLVEIEGQPRQRFVITRN
jgi:ribosomal protein S18 acetylase RimI-like enzyme